jgi:hypothetical protein
MLAQGSYFVNSSTRRYIRMDCGKQIGSEEVDGSEKSGPPFAKTAKGTQEGIGDLSRRHPPKLAENPEP